MSNNELLIFIPTYNENENIEQILYKILDLDLSADILFIDDNSPDGTGKKLDQLAIKYSNISVIHRKKKMGIGSAHFDAINFAYNNCFKKLITMDCDFSHSPEYILDFLANSDGADIVVGSRFLQDNSLAEWNMLRKSLTHLGHIATRRFLKMPYDATGFFRLYRLDNISRNFLYKSHSKSYSFSFESLFILHVNNYRIVEIPINLPSRVYGHSKMRIYDAIYSLVLLFKLYFLSKLSLGYFELSESILQEN